MAERWSVLIVLALTAGCTSSGEKRAEIFTEDGLHLYRNGAYREAGESFEAALALRPGDPSLLYNLGRCHEHLGATDRAEKAFRECLQRSPGHAETQHALVGLLYATGRRAEAVTLTDEWIAREPGRAAAYAQHAWLLRQDGDLPRAQARAQQALHLDPQDIHALMEMGDLYEAMNRPDRALVLYERAQALQPGHPDVRQHLERLKGTKVGRPRPD